MESKSLEDWLLAITHAEQSIAKLAESAQPPKPELVHDLEQAVGAVMEQPAHLPQILGLIAGHSNEVLGLTQPMAYGAVRALYWWIVVTAGRGEEREILIEVLAALPEVHSAVIDNLIDNLVEARVDGRLILDASYLPVILELRAAFPDSAGLYSRLLRVIGESMTPEERTEFFSLFLDDLEDPLLVGLTIKNLLKGADPSFGLVLAEQVADDATLPLDVRIAASRAVATSADVYSATSFVTERAELLRNKPDLWFSLGWREESFVALEAKYQDLAAKGADPTARRLLVSAMQGAEPEDLLRIAGSETDSKVMGQALMTASSKVKTSSSAEAAMSFIESRSGPGELTAIYRVASASNLAKFATSSGDPLLEKRAVHTLEALAADSSEHPSIRKQAIKSLKAYLPPNRIEELLMDSDS